MMTILSSRAVPSNTTQKVSPQSSQPEGLYVGDELYMKYPEEANPWTEHRWVAAEAWGGAVGVTVSWDRLSFRSAGTLCR